MSINVYSGLMGSGKSYEVVKSVILPAFSNGRRIVTNIDGIDAQKIRDFLISEGNDEASFGQVIHVKNEDLSLPNFFPQEGIDNEIISGIVLPGDLVCIDEAWRFWGVGEKISENHMQFFRMHRHYTHPTTGISCDIALLIQSVGDLHRSIKAVVEVTYKMTKLKMLGLNRSYRIELYEGASVRYSHRFERFNRRYDKRIFPLYQSYAGNAKGIEKSIDKRGNIFQNPMFWVSTVVVMIVLISSVSYLWELFHPSPIAHKENKLPLQKNDHVAPTVIKPDDESLTFRIGGQVVIDGFAYVAIVDNEGILRLENAHLFVGKNTNIVGQYKGKKISTWTGQRFINSGVSP